MRIQICANKGAGPFLGPIRGKIGKLLISLQKSSHEQLAGMHWYLVWITLWEWRVKFVQMKSLGSYMDPPQRFKLYIVIYRDIFKKIFFSRTAATNGTICSMDHSEERETQVCSNKDPEVANGHATRQHNFI